MYDLKHDVYSRSEEYVSFEIDKYQAWAEDQVYSLENEVIALRKEDEALKRQDVRSRDLVTVLITNGDLGNINESVSYFRDYLNDDNKLYIFLLGGSKSLHSYEPLKNIGAKIYNANNANEFCDMVLTDME